MAFALSPALATSGVLDYSTKVGAQLYKDATTKLGCDKFDCQAANIKVFLQALTDRAHAYGLSTILEIPRDLAQPLLNLISLLDQYGQVDMDHLRTHDTSYINTPSRAVSR